MATFTKALVTATKPATSATVLLRNFYGLALAIPHAPVPLAISTPQLSRDFQYFNFTTGTGAQTVQKTKKRSSFIDLAIWLALVAQVVFYVGFARPQQKKQQMTESGFTEKL
uniref:RIC3 domain-containing protein n=1 Tax=Steinernema glaseri TaxID=37863 RepID=A0A1I7XZP3_9BILA